MNDGARALMRFRVAAACHRDLTGASAEVHIAGVSAAVQRRIDARLQTLGRRLVLHDEASAAAVERAASRYAAFTRLSEFTLAESAQR